MISFQNFPGLTVLAKRDIPVDMKFGPFVGDAKTLTRQEIKKIRETSTNYPLLFLNQNTVLDVSNESMCFIRNLKLFNNNYKTILYVLHRCVELDEFRTVGDNISRAKHFAV